VRASGASRRAVQRCQSTQFARKTTPNATLSKIRISVPTTPDTPPHKFPVEHLAREYHTCGSRSAREPAASALSTTFGIDR